MANEYYATNYLTGDGVTTVWDVAFAGNSPDQGDGTEAYLDSQEDGDVKASLLVDNEDGTTTETPVSGTLVSATQFQIVPAIPEGQVFKIYRDTLKRYPLTDFKNFAAITAEDLDTSIRQVLYVMQEVFDVTGQVRVVADEAARNAYIAIEIANTTEDAAQRSEAAAESAEESADRAEASATSAAHSEAAALVAAEASGEVRFYDSYNDALVDLPSLAEGQVIEVFQDETRQYQATRYRVEGEDLVFKLYLRRMNSLGAPYFGHSKVLTQTDLDLSPMQPNSNYASLGPITIAPNTELVVPPNTDYYVLAGPTVSD